MNEHVILIEKVRSTENLCQDLSVISDTSFRNTAKGSVRITSNPKASPIIITTPRPIQYSSNKAIPCNYGSDFYYHGVKKELLTIKDEVTGVIDPDIDNIARSSKVTRSERVFPP